MARIHPNVSRQLALSINQPKQTWRGKPLHVTVTDVGTKPLHVTTESLTLRAHCQMTANTGVHVSPTGFTLQPGHSVVTSITVPNSAGDYGVLYVAHSLTSSAGGNLAGGVGSQVLVGHAKSCVPAVTHHVAAVAPASSGFPLPFVLAGILALLLVIVGALMWRRFRHV